MTPKQKRFVEEYLVDLNAAAAYRRAGYLATGNSAEVNASRLLRNAQVKSAIATARDRQSQKLQISSDRAIAEAWNILLADPRDLVAYHIGCCRYCWGNGFRFQRTAAEMARDRAAQAAETTGAFDEQGGIGFHAKREPNRDCPECFGDGVGRVRVMDTRHFSPAAAALYAGIKQTRDGIEVKMHSKVDALEKVCKHLGLYDRVRAGTDLLAKVGGAGTESLAEQGRALVAAVAAGGLSVSQGSQMLTALASLGKLVETDELAARIAALEAACVRAE